MLRRRKSVNNLTAAEKADLVQAIKALKANGKYDQYVNEHNAAMAQATPWNGEPADPNIRNVAHRGPAFGPWHREMLRRFELDLQLEVPGVTLPYWDWAADAALADPRSSALWGADLMGGDGDPANSYFVSTGPFRYDAADPNSWHIVPDPGGGDPGPGLTRTLGAGAPALPNQGEIDTVEQITPYDSPSWNTASDPSFRNQLEGWRGPNLHNRVHVWVGGSMLPGTSPNDPVFFLHHCNVDRLWWQWQMKHPDSGYVPVSQGPVGHQLDDQMAPWDAATTPRSTLDIHHLGYYYDTDPAMGISFLVDQSTFSQDEVDLQLPGTASFAAGWVAVDGLTPSDLGLTTANLGNPPAGSIPTFAITLDPSLSAAEATAIQSMLSAPSFAGPVIPQDPSLPPVPQRFLFPFVVHFNGDGGFQAMRAANLTFTNVTISATLTVPAGTFDSSAQIELTTGGDPRFVDVDPSNPTQFPSWLSFDLRFFTMTVPAGTTGHRFGGNLTGAGDAPAFIASVIANLTANNGTVGGDSFAGLSQDEAATKLAFHPQDNAGNPVFNFAVARVRLASQAATPAQKVRVFFRLFQAQNTVSSFDESHTYRYWSDGNAFGRKVPLAGIQADQAGNLEYVTIPCFATERVTLSNPAQSMADQTDDPNAYDLVPDPGHEKDYFFGCWIDNNQTAGVLPATLPAGPLPPAGQSDPAFDGPFSGVTLESMQQAMTAFPHQCLIAEIRYDDTPVPAGATTSTSDKLAQRNIAWIDGPNPGIAASRRMSHPVQLRPSHRRATHPDELLILWRKTPDGTTAELFLPGADAAEIVALAESRSTMNRLYVVDAHTVGFPSGGATFVPLPVGTGLAAGLLSIDLPEGVRKGDSYFVDVRQLTDAYGARPAPPQRIDVRMMRTSDGEPVGPAPMQRDHGGDGSVDAFTTWRRVDGAFRFALEISTKTELLLSEERLLATLRWMHAHTPASKRWYPVLTRYIGDVAGRVHGFGGDPDAIKPSQIGAVPGWRGGDGRDRGLGGGGGGRRRHGGSCCAGATGKVAGIVYDHFGDFASFVLETDAGLHRRFETREAPLQDLIRNASDARTRLTVFSEDRDDDEVRAVLVHPPHSAGCACDDDCDCDCDDCAC